MHVMYWKFISGVFRKAYILYHFGGLRFYCPVCKGRFRKFLPFGVIPRPNALCPNCGALERHRLLWIALEKAWRKGIISKGGMMLHVAPEPCLSKKFKKFYNYISADLNPKKAMVQMDITDIKYPDNTFDAIVCNHVLEHVPDDSKALKELYRVLKWGWASILVPMKGEFTQEDSSRDRPGA